MNSILVLISCLAAANAYSLRPIIGGEPAKADQAPWQIWLLTVDESNEESPLCGGSIVGKRAVLTANHCCDGQTASGLRVRYGGIDRENLAHVSNVKTVIPNPSYTSFQYGYDYCVLILETEVEESEDVQIILIADKAPANGTLADLTGWGRTIATSEDLPRYLQYGQLYILSQAECDKVWAKAHIEDFHITETMICTEKQTTSFCMGDSGGALTVNKEVVGVVSFGHAGFPTDTTVWPNVYADAAAGKDWIEKQIQDNLD